MGCPNITEKLLAFSSPTSPDSGDGVNRSIFFSKTVPTQTNKDICTVTTCVDPEIFCRGGRVYTPQLILQFTEGSSGFITHLPGGGVQMSISIETHITIA